MNNLKTKFFTTLLLLLHWIAVHAGDTIEINQNQYFIDSGHQLILTNLDATWVNTTWPNSKTHIQLHETCTFSIPIDQVVAGMAYDVYVPSQNSVFTLYFTSLPIISIATDFQIVDEPNVLASFKLIETDQNHIESFIGIQYRGAWSQNLPKKSMEIEFWTDATGSETQDVSLLGMATDDDWNLQAMYNEPLRIRSKTNNDLWRMINTLHYQDLEPEAINGIRMKYAELFINNEYRGIYCLGEKVNQKQLKLKKHNGTIRGELYKGNDWGAATTFTGLPAYNNNSSVWDGFEYEHPDEETNWSRLHDLVGFVINASHTTFRQEYHNRFDTDNLVDYFILLNLLRATDNTGKNIYIAKYNTDGKYFYVPWDLDGTFGTIWNGSNENITNDLLRNGFYNRLMADCNTNGFRAKLKSKWLQLRSTFVTRDALMEMFLTNHNLLQGNGVYDRESLVWPEFTHNDAALTYMSDWIASRLAYLDTKFTEPCHLSIAENAYGNRFEIYPNPTQDLLRLNSSFTGNYNICIYNHLGQFIQSERANEPEKTITLGHLKTGMYFIKIEYNDYTETHKIILAQ